MVGSEVLLTVAEVAVALAGFSSVVAIFVRRESGSWTGPDVLRLWQLIIYSLAAVFFAFFPFLLFYCGLTTTDIWIVSSALLGGFITVNTAGALVTALRVWRQDRAAFNGTILATVVFLAVVAVSVQVLNVQGVIFKHSLGGYLVGLIWLLLASGFFFVRLLGASGIHPADKGE